MGFLDGFGRLVKGEPVFRPEDQPGDGKTHFEEPPQSVVPSASEPVSDEKYIPHVAIDDIDCEVEPHHDHMTLDMFIKNESQVVVEVTKVLLFGQTAHVTHFLKPGEQRKFRVYEGPRPKDTYQHACDVYFRTENTDSFYARHNFEFEPHSDGDLMVRRARFEPPIRDI